MAFLCAHIPDSARFYTFYTAQHKFRVFRVLKRRGALGDRALPELEVEMETGTGKTFVYIKAIFELNKPIVTIYFS